MGLIIVYNIIVYNINKINYALLNLIKSYRNVNVFCAYVFIVCGCSW